MKGASIKEEDTSFEFVQPSQLAIYGRDNSDSNHGDTSNKDQQSRFKDHQIVKNDFTQQQQQMILSFNLVTTAFVNEDGTIDRTIRDASNKLPINATNTVQPPTTTQSAAPPPAIDRSRKPIKSNNTTPTKLQQEQMIKSKFFKYWIR